MFDGVSLIFYLQITGKTALCKTYSYNAVMLNQMLQSILKTRFFKINQVDSISNFDKVYKLNAEENL